MKTSHATINLEAAKDLAPEYGMTQMGEARVVRDELGAEGIGLSFYRMNAGRRVGFGHRHRKAEEMYEVLAGSGRFKVDEEIFSIAAKDVVYCPPAAMREWQAGPDGLELMAFGGHAEGDADMQSDWWTE